MEMKSSAIFVDLENSYMIVDEHIWVSCFAFNRFLESYPNDAKNDRAIPYFDVHDDLHVRQCQSLLS